MKIENNAQAGTLESSDVYVTILANPNDTIDIQIKSIVYQQFGQQIYLVAQDTLSDLGITSCILLLEDKGALDFTIKARIESAVQRSIC